MVQRFILSDYSKLIDIWERAVEKTHTFLSKVSYDKICKSILEYFNNAEIYVYKKNGKDIAFMGVKGDKLEVLISDPEYSKQDIDTFMLNYALNFLNIRFVDVDAGNQHALEFYKTHGFQEVAQLEHELYGYPIIHLAYESGISNV